MQQMMTISTKQDLLAHLATGATIITPNNRLALQLLRDYAVQAQRPVLDKPRCLAYQAFLRSLYQHFSHTSRQPLPLLLSDLQCRFLWQHILTEHRGTLPNKGLIQHVQDSWTRCQLWQIEPDHPAFAATEQTRLFQSWRHRMEKKLQVLHALTPDQLVAWFLTQSPVSLPGPLIWACFDDYTPEQQALQAYFTERGVEQHYADWVRTDATFRVYAATDNQDEFQQLIAWLGIQLSKGHERIGVVVPDLQQQAASLHRLMTDHFPVDTVNLSLGKNLTDYALISHALCWLNLDNTLLTRQQANLLLYSPFLGHSQQEFMQRVQYGQNAALLRETRIDFSLFVKDLHQAAPQLADLLRTLSPYPDMATPLQWVECMYQRLHQMQFPGEYPLDSANYQTYQRFLLLLDEFKALNYLASPMNQEQALATLTDLAQNSVFQPRKQPAPVQIMGLLEAAGLEFDCLWVTGLTEACLPQKTRPSAFIPLSLQRERQMPYALPEREFALAEKTLNRLCHAAPECILSYPAQSQDKPNLPSPLLQGIPTCQAFWHAPSHPAPVPLDVVTETYHFPVQATEHIAGGTALLANQAKCPFRAFAAHRLHAKAAPEVSDGPDARERGQIVHKVMEMIWTVLTNQASLLSLPTAELEDIIDQAIEHSLKPYTVSRRHSFPPLVQTVETHRLKRLVQACLEWEKQRPAFVVDALEQHFNFPLAGLDFNVRIDRMDALENGKKWVIDYKSSIVSTPWHDERPTEPQLLLYALLNDDINTILFAELKNGQLQCKGLSEEKQDVAGIRTLKSEQSWSDCREGWLKQLQNLADEFVQGHCPPQPAKASTCQLCDFQSLCRFAVDRDAAYL